MTIGHRNNEDSRRLELKKIILCSSGNPFFRRNAGCYQRSAVIKKYSFNVVWYTPRKTVVRSQKSVVRRQKTGGSEQPARRSRMTKEGDK